MGKSPQCYVPEDRPTPSLHTLAHDRQSGGSETGLEAVMAGDLAVADFEAGHEAVF